MKTKYIILIILVTVAIAGCAQQLKKPSDSSNIKPQSPLIQPAQIEFTDKEITDAVYSDYKIPNDFFKDTLEKGEKISDSVYYERISENNKWVFFCTNDFNSAKHLVDENIAEYNQRDFPDRILIETTENEKFFEFKTLENQTTSPDRKYYLRYRVYKCTYISDLQHGMYSKKDNSISDGYVGTFAQKPITTKNVKELVEFLWYSAFRNYNTGGSKVLSSFTKESNNSIKHTIFETETVGGDWGMCDQITLIKSVYTVSKNSEEINLTQENIKTVEGNCH
ncbi:hypothetical protein KKE19_04635 [Patescibacteria group bacterium]|nr:hypothetical protein [Patescibacteria group bacterium]MCG2699931.1 hypothetical protein [Candidatus Parcubacteria bacterium]